MKTFLADRSPSLQRIVERRLRHWELQTHKPSDRPQPRPFLLDFIAISREAGSRGEVLATALGERLGWRVYDRELLDLMSGDEECRRHLYSTLDERQSSWIDGLLVLCAPETNKPPNDYVQQLSRTLLTIAHHEHAVFVGRGAYLLLPPDVGLRVHVTARLADRIEVIACERAVSEEEAAHFVRQQDQQRQDFLNQTFGHQGTPLDPFDLAVNLSRLSIEKAVEIIIAALHQRCEVKV